jgi:hypothetical protein
MPRSKMWGFLLTGVPTLPDFITQLGVLRQVQSYRLQLQFDLFVGHALASVP